MDIDMVYKKSEVFRSLDHPSTVKVKNCFTLADFLVVFIMEFLKGDELLQRLCTPAIKIN